MPGQRSSNMFCFLLNGIDRSRTDDLLRVKQALFQLSYDPAVSQQFTSNTGFGSSGMWASFGQATSGVFWPGTQDRMALVVRSGVKPDTLSRAVIGAIHSLDPDQPVYGVRSMDDVLDRSLSQPRLNTTLLGMFAAVSLLLTSVGIYGVITFSVGQRLREFGIRMALGAKRADLIRFVLREAGILICCGVALGLAAAWALTRLISALLFNVRATDWRTFSGAVLAMVIVALLAAYVPARRAANANPLTILN